MGAKGKMVSSFRLTTDQCSHQWRGTHTGGCYCGCHARCGGWTSHAHGAAECPYIQRAPCNRSSMSGTCTIWQGSTCTALKVHKFLRLLGPEDTRTAVGSLPSGAHIQVCLPSIHRHPTACTHHWEQPNSSLQEVHSEEWLKKQLCYLSDCRRHRSGLQRMGIAAPDHPPATPVP